MAEASFSCVCRGTVSAGKGMVVEVVVVWGWCNRGECGGSREFALACWCSRLEVYREIQYQVRGSQHKPTISGKGLTTLSGLVKDLQILLKSRVYTS